MRKNKKLAVELRRDNDGKVFSQVRDENVEAYKDPTPVVIDRQSGRFLDKDTVTRRAMSLAVLLDIPFMDYPEVPCIAKRGGRNCLCPDCVEERAQGRRT